MATEPVYMFTDGASRGNPGPGGYGTILRYKNFEKELTEGFRKTTNNRMELLAVIKGLAALKEKGLQVHIYSDSQYVVNTIEKDWITGWQRKGWKKVKNPDLWQKYLEVANGQKIKFHWIRGHSGHPENERCDRLAVQSAESGNLKVDSGYEMMEGK